MSESYILFYVSIFVESRFQAIFYSYHGLCIAWRFFQHLFLDLLRQKAVLNIEKILLNHKFIKSIWTKLPNLKKKIQSIIFRDFLFYLTPK